MPALPSNVSAPAAVSISVATEDSITFDAVFLIVPVKAKSETVPERLVFAVMCSLPADNRLEVLLNVRPESPAKDPPSLN